MREQTDWIKKALLHRFDEVITVSDSHEDIAKLKQQMFKLQSTLEKTMMTKDKLLLRTWIDTQDDYMTKQLQWCYSKGFHDGVQLLVYLMSEEVE
jgi:hypothetical protein